MYTTIDVTVSVKVPVDLLTNSTVMTMREYGERFFASAFEPVASCADLVKEYHDAINRDPDFQELIEYGFRLFDLYYSVFKRYTELINDLKLMSIENESAIAKILLEIKAHAVDLTKIKSDLIYSKKELKNYVAFHAMTAMQLNQMELFMEKYRDIITEA